MYSQQPPAQCGVVMIEPYAILAVFVIQILVGSVLGPALFISRARAPVANFPAERFAQLFPGIDRDRSGERFAARYRALNTGIAVLGLVLLGWLFNLMRRPDWSQEWNQAKVVGVFTLYLLAQTSPSFFNGWKAARSMKALKSSLADGKRKAVLQRRGLFDFVSPLTVWIAVLSYFLFAAFVLYVRRHPYPGFDGLPLMVVITLFYVLSAFLVYAILYGRNRNPVATRSTRLYTIGVGVKILIYTCIGATVFMSVIVTLGLLHQQKWGLFAVGAFFVICMSLGAIGPRRPPTPSTKYTESSLPIADLDRFAGRYANGRGFAFAIARDGTTLWWLRLHVPGAQPVPILPEAPLTFFWKDIEQRIRFTTDASDVVTGAEIVTHSGYALTVRRLEHEDSPAFGGPIQYGCGPA
jgi:hypothetical protein